MRDISWEHGPHTAIDEMVDLSFGHAVAFGSSEGVLLFLAPFVDIPEVLGVTGCGDRG